MSHSQLNDCLRLSVDSDPVLVKDVVSERLSPGVPQTKSRSTSVNIEEGVSLEKSEGQVSFQRDSIVGDICLLTEGLGKKSSLAVPSINTRATDTGLTVSQQIDWIIDQYIEIESNKRMMEQNVNWFCLTFKLPQMESKFHQIKDGVFKSNAVCVAISWLLLISSQMLVLPLKVQLLVVFVTASVIIAVILVVVMGSEFYSLPSSVKKVSVHLENNRGSRNFLACVYIVIIFVASSSVLVSCETQLLETRDN